MRLLEKYYFFDSNSGIGDRRLYSAADWSNVLSKFLENGIYVEGDNLTVTADGTAMTVTVGTGVAFIDGHMYENDAPLTLNVDAAEASLDRIDLVVLRLDLTEQNRYIKTFVVKGEAAAAPVAPLVQDTTFIKEIALAEIRVTAGKSIIEQAQITDKRPADFVDPFVDGSRITTLENNLSQHVEDFNSEKQLIWNDMAKYQIPKLTDNLGNAVSLADGTSFNSIMTTGWYRINSSVGAPSKSANNPANWWYLEVIRHSELWITQVAYDFDNGTHIRRLKNGQWTGWVRLGDEQNAFTRMQRWNAYTLPANAWARLTWETKVFDDPGLYVSNEDTFQIPYSGWYRFNLSLLAYVASNTDFYAELWKVGSSYKDAMINHRATNASNYNLTGLATVWANAGDKFEIVAKQTDSFTKNILTAFLEIKREG